jgi:hypothetical protein
VRQVRRVTDTKRMPKQSATALRQEVEDMVSHIRVQLTEKAGIAPSGDLRDQLGQRTGKISAARAIYQTARIRLSLTVSQAKSKGGTAGALPLRDAIAKQREDDAARDLAALDAAAARGRAEGLKVLEAEKAKLAKQAAEQEANRLRREREQKEAQEQARAAAEKSQREKAAKLARAKDWAEVWLQHVPSDEETVRKYVNANAFRIQHSSAMDRAGVRDCSATWNHYEAQCQKELGRSLYSLWLWRERGWKD